ncbi:DMT family transporter [Streptomyces sp. NPDC050161]|uniref:DMT family transporter n=1 Tax=Streptomyces sp. NPDC050161 TaxID=3365604 RepID=UPI00379638D8
MRGYAGPLRAAALVVTWSSGFIGARLGTDAAGTLPILMWRFVLVAALLVPWWCLTRYRRLSWREIGIQSLVGLLAQSVYLLSSFGAIELGVPPGTTSLVEGLQPLFAAALVGPLLGELVTRRQWWGLSIGLIGVVLVIGEGLQLGGDRPLWAYAIPFAGMVALTAATIIQRRSGLATPLADALTIQSCASAVFFVLLGLASGQTSVPLTGSFWFALGWVVVLSTLGGYGFYWLNLKHSDVSRVNSLIYLTPPTVTLWAYLMFGDSIGLLAGLGFVICAVAVVLVHLPNRRPVRARQEPASSTDLVAPDACDDRDDGTHRVTPPRCG